MTSPEYSKEYRIKNKEKIKAYQKQWHIKNKEKIVAKASKWNKENVARRKEIRDTWNNNHPEQKVKINKNYRLEKRKLVINYYSQNKNCCNCCGEKMIYALTIDHIDGNGNDHRRNINIRGGHNFYSWLIKNNYPEGYQVLCFNCNIAKGHYGTCPHNDMPATITMPL